MNSISIDNEKYVKATDIARELGYTADYVGQLCRAGKIDAQLVGRSWYVSEESIRAHKKNRYRSTKTVSKKTIATSLEARDLDMQDTFSVPIAKESPHIQSSYAQKSFYSRTPSHPTPKYSDDASDLIPTAVKVKTGRVSVSLGDAQSVSISSHSGDFDFNPTPRTEIRFRGSLPVSDVYETQEKDSFEENLRKQDVVPDTENESIEPVEPSKVHEEVDSKTKTDTKKTENTHTIKVKHLRKEPKRKGKKLKMENHPSGVVGMQRGRIVDRNPMGGTLKIDVPPDTAYTTRVSMYIITASLVTAVAFSFLILGIQADMQVVGSDLVTSYTFTFDVLLAAVYSAW